MIKPKTLLWLCAVWLGCCPASAQVVEECFLYPVAGGRGRTGVPHPSFPLRQDGETFITINNIYRNNTKSEIRSGDKCLARVVRTNHNQRDYDGCPTFITDDDFVTVVLRRSLEGLGVYQREGLVKEELVPFTLEDGAQLQVTTEVYVNVAYNCHGRCFQFEKATIHKSFEDQSNGELTFYGRTKEEGNYNRKIYVLRDKKWSQHKIARLPMSDLSASHWSGFTAKPNYTKSSQEYGMMLDIEYTPASTCNPTTLKTEVCGIQPCDLELTCGKESVFSGSASVPSRDLYMKFENTENVRWAMFCKPLETQDPVKQRGETSTTITVEGPSGLATQATNILKEEVPLWVVLAVGAVGVLLLITTIALCTRVRRPQKQCVSPTAPKATCGQNDYDDPADHTYEYVDLEALKIAQQKAQSEVNTSQPNNRNSCTSINSFYGCVNKYNADGDNQGSSE